MIDRSVSATESITSAHSFCTKLKPDVKVYSEVWSLLLGAACGNYGEPVLESTLANLFVCEVAVSHMSVSYCLS